MNNLDLEQMEEALNSSIKQKNTLTQNEFQHFAPLFSEGGEREQLDRLGDEWAMRVSLYDEVNVIDNSGKVVATLPPALGRINSLSEIDPNGMLLTALEHEMSIDNPIHSRIKEVGDLFIKGIKKVNNLTDEQQDTDSVNIEGAEWS